jgi:hypothetical protein
LVVVLFTHGRVVMLRGMLGFLWRQLPDRCEMPGCTRRGVRGNENIMVVIGDKRRMMCDECVQVHLLRRRFGAEYVEVQRLAIDALNEDQQ